MNVAAEVIIDADEETEEQEQQADVDRGDEVDPDADDAAGEPAEAEAEPEDSKPEPTIPKARLDEVLARLRAAEEALAERQQTAAGDTSTQAFDKLMEEWTAKNDKYHQLYEDAEFDQAKELAREIKQVDLRMTEEKSRMAYEEQRWREADTEYRGMVRQRETEIAAENAWLIPDSKEYDKEARGDFEMSRDGFLAKNPGRNLEAMNYALERVLRLRGESPAASPSKVSNKLAAKIEASRRQPPRPIGVGARAAGSTTPTDVSRMSDDEYRALTPSQKAILRGDVVKSGR